MKKTMVVCGDSFNYGIGCVDLGESPYGVLVSKTFDCDLIRLARGSATNFSIALQADYAATKITPKPNLVIIGMTGFDRIEWQSEDAKIPRTKSLGLENLNYHLYPPHNTPSSPLGILQNFYLENDPAYNPSLLTEQVHGIDDYISVYKKGMNVSKTFYKRLNSEPIPKLELIMKYYFEIFQGDIKVRYDSAMIYQSYMRCVNAGINCLILTTFPHLFDGLVTADNICEIDWGKLSIDHPDTIGSWHTSEEGHRIVASKIIEKIKALDLL
jgi:hypothetical protein